MSKNGGNKKKPQGGCKKRLRVHRGVKRHRTNRGPCVGLIGDGAVKWIPPRPKKSRKSIDKVLRNLTGTAVTVED